MKPSRALRRSSVFACVGAILACSACGGNSPSASGAHASPTRSSAAPATSSAPAASPSAASPSAAAPSAPAAGGTVKEVLPSIEAFVEKERGLTFKRPVKAEFLGRKAFLKKLDQGDQPPSAKDIESTTATLSSIGLVSPSIDIAKAFDSADDAGTLGFYDSKTKRLYVKGTKATYGVRAVLSHELTHALTDQWFGISRPKLDKSNQELGDAFDALVEGDAERTRLAYEATVLTPAERKVAEKEENAGPTPHVPLVVLELIGLPYIVGPQFVDAVVAKGGISALNAAYRHPPRSSEQLVDPTTYFSHDNPKHVDRPAAGGVVVDHGDLGYIGLLLMLEHGLPRAQAQQAIVGWGGDQYVSYRVGTKSWCLRDSVVMDYGEATDAFDAALTKWVATTHGRARIEHSGPTTTFESCSG